MTGRALARRTLGAGSLWVFAVGASSPLTVLVGGVVAMYALTGVVAVPLSFVVIGVVVGLLAVGYVAMARHVPHAAPFYALLARGLNPSVGVAGAVIALLGYNAIQISLYGLCAVTLSGLVGGPWWVWAAVIWAIVAVLGQLRGVTNAKLLGTLLTVELAIIVLFDLAALANPAEGLDMTPWSPSQLAVPGIGGVLAFAMAAFVGGETGPAFGEEARADGAVGRAMAATVAFLGLFYAVSAWAFAVAVGPDHVADAARDPDQGPLGVLGTVYGPGIITVATVLLVTSVIAAMSAFHATVARYVFALAREGVLPPALAKLSGGVRGGAPLAGSAVQSVVAAVVVTAFVLVGADPMAIMFTWLSTIGGMSVLVLLVLSALSARAYFARGGGSRESVLVRTVAPTLGAVTGFLVIVFMLSNLGALLGVSEGSRWPWIIPVLIAGAGVIGLAWGGGMRRSRPGVYQQIGRGTPNPLTVGDHRLEPLEL
ncbi:APC family permease [Catellatospora sp. KI3]|uniref:APC family permease n=1 Tax=Catellatospora sp. KI3 TaxID=3041620 RepID=UPI0024823273|nr:APC family permease [Catellatospora sp. KI3]MDI1462976.1 APC family permease [Catellatospora sp. KI3]